jgi:heme exporter protein C
MRTPLLISAVGFSLLFFALHMKAMRNEILRRRVKTLTLSEVERSERLGASIAAK